MNSQISINLIKNACLKEVDSCIDLVLTNRKYSFKITASYKTGLSDHHNLNYPVMKTTVKREKSKKLLYRNYSNFS